MHYLIFLTVLVVGVLSQEEDVFVFSHDKNVLAHCIEHYILKCDPYYAKGDIGKIIAYLTAESFSGKTKMKTALLNKINKFFSFLRSNNILEAGKVHGPLVVAREALFDCSQSSQVPVFETEAPELGRILDLILVYWPLHMKFMIYNNYGRSILRRYAKDAQETLISMLKYFDTHKQFRVVMREMFMQRAQFYFDGRNTQFPFLRYR